MSIKFGLKTQRIFLGDKEVIKAYKGTTLLYEKLSTPSIPPRYVQTTTADFNASGDYTGTEQYIILPADKPYGYRIRKRSVIGVTTSGDYLTDASNMFYGNSSLYLELDFLDTSNVTNMSAMFRDSRSGTLDLSSFDTSKVTDMGSMFRDSQATILDLSSFDTSNVTNKFRMLYGSQATTGYARTQTDADNLNSGTSKPDTLTFVVK